MQERAIITVVGKDTVGIIAKVCTYLAKERINILDISQTIMQGNFTMIMVVDLEKMTAPFGEVVDACEKLGKELGVSIRIQRQEIFDAMHEI